MDTTKLLEGAQAVLKANDRGTHTVPAPHLYPYQWLWDSCFTAIGLRHYDVNRAQQEILSLLSGQWHNGMLPHMIMGREGALHRDIDIWRSWQSPEAPDDIHTSGITQPPMVAEAVWQIGQKLPAPERRTWYKTVLPALFRYHQWLYNERDPHQEGLTLQIHPWETGLDNTPSWMHELHVHQLPLWIRFVAKLRLGRLLEYFRRDTRSVPVAQRESTIDALALYSTQRRLRRKKYDINQILTHSLFAIEDVAFNSIFIRANSLLVSMAKYSHIPLPDGLSERIIKTEEALESLWDPYANLYFSRNFVTHQLVHEPSIGSLLPLYAGSISQERAKHLVDQLTNQMQFASKYPVPSVPVSSEWFNPICYWQGPVWVNTNWLIVEGLKRYGYNKLAAAITKRTLEMVSKSHYSEYFSPLDGRPLGAPALSWTAALTIDFLS